MVKAREPESAPITRKVFIAFGVVAVFLVFALGLILGMTAINPAQRNLEEKLLIVRKKAAECHIERERARAQHRKSPDFDKTPVGKIQRENDILADENNALMEENENLREEKMNLEETLTELRNELEDKTQISVHHREKLHDIQKTGNISDTLKEFLVEQQEFGGVDKDELIPKLIDELRWRKTRFQACQRVSAKAAGRIAEVKVEAQQRLQEEKDKHLKDQLAQQAAELQKTKELLQQMQALGKIQDTPKPVKESEPAKVTSKTETVAQTKGAAAKPDDTKAGANKLSTAELLLQLKELGLLKESK
jgi:regulator of replication initiation timing